MHMANSLVSPAVGGVMIAASAGLVAFSVFQTRKNFDAKKLRLMGIAGAFVFAMQMVNFAIPCTGSSGHIVGAVLLSALLGACPAFLVMSSVLLIQSLFFADGGLLALGCNIFNMGFFGCFLAYPLIFKPLAGDFSKFSRVFFAAVLASVVGLQLGAFSVVLQTLASGISQLNFANFALQMQPIHFAIGAAEGIISAFILLAVLAVRPQVFSEKASGGIPASLAAASLLGASLFIAGGVSLFASPKPDGLEWAIERTVGSVEFSQSGAVYAAAESLQQNLSFMPDYSLPALESEIIGTSVSGIAGTLITLAFAGTLGLMLGSRKSEKSQILA